MLVRWGAVLIGTCSAFKNANVEIHQRVLRVEICWKQMSLQLDFLQRIWAELDREHQRLQEECLANLVMNLSAVDVKLSRFHKNEGSVLEMNIAKDVRKIEAKQKAAYALLKGHLDHALEDMESWQKRFDPSWYLILRIADSKRIDEELHRTTPDNKYMKAVSHIRTSLLGPPRRDVSVSLPEQVLEAAKIHDLACSNAKVMHRANADETFILDNVPYPTDSTVEERENVIRNLTRKLKHADPPHLALLKCAGFVERHDLNQFTLAFRTPKDLKNPRSLRSVLCTRQRNHSLSERFRLANQLATAVCSLHTLGFVHKSIRPENIITFTTNQSSIGAGFLLGFEQVRPEKGRTRLIGDTDWEKNLYRHPNRQGEQLHDPYVMQHDIYSLGVCLLEIGLWSSFVQYSDDGVVALRSEEYVLGVDARDEAEMSKYVYEELVALAANSLASHMGDKYAKVVHTCLTCLDEDSVDFGDESEFQDEDGVLIAVRYIEKVRSFYESSRRKKAYNLRSYSN